MIYEVNISILLSKNDEKWGMKSRDSIGDMLEILLISEHFDHEKKTVPAYIRGFDLFKPSMSGSGL